MAEQFLHGVEVMLKSFRAMTAFVRFEPSKAR